VAASSAHVLRTMKAKRKQRPQKLYSDKERAYQARLQELRNEGNLFANMAPTPHSQRDERRFWHDVNLEVERRDTALSGSRHKTGRIAR